MTINEPMFKCTICGRIGTVGRCCGIDTRIPINAAAKKELANENGMTMTDTPTKQCTRCGKCCILGLCEPAQEILGIEYMPPCPFLVVFQNEISCAFVVAESFMPEEMRLFSNGIGIGTECTIVGEENTSDVLKNIQWHIERAGK